MKNLDKPAKKANGQKYSAEDLSAVFKKFIEDSSKPQAENEDNSESE